MKLFEEIDLLCFAIAMRKNVLHQQVFKYAPEASYTPNINLENFHNASTKQA